MTIIVLDHDRLKICLTRCEMLEPGFDTPHIDQRSPATRQALAALLRKAKTQTGFHPGGERLVAEILPDENEGCVISFTALPGLRLSPGGAEIEPAVYAFSGALELMRGIRALYGSYGHRIYKSSLYAWREGYRLVVRPLDYTDGQSGRFLEEYARFVGSGEVLAAYIDEHGELLARDNAVDVFGRGLGG